MSFAERYGPWAIVAGASEGTGQEFARQLAAQGLNLVLIARRKGPLEALADEIRGAPGVECLTASIDLGSDDAAARIFAAADGREIGLFVSNAGADPHNAMFLDREVESWDGLARMNTLTMMRCCHRFGRAMRDRGRGGLLLVNSGACYIGLSELAVYAAGKAFMLNFAEGLWAELRGHGVDVLTLVLTQTDTPLFRSYLAAKGLPFPDNAASPVDVARTGLERLPHGPIHNWGYADDEPGFAPLSPAQIRARIEAIEGMHQAAVRQARG